MGNYCSSGQNKKDKDNTSEKSEESPSYQLADKTNKKLNNDVKGAPLADPEPISDISTTTGQNTSPIDNTQSITTNGKQLQHQQSVTSGKFLQNIQTGNLSSVTDSVTNSPLASTPPCDLPQCSVINLPTNLMPLYGRPVINRRTEKDKKIVVIVLSAENLTKVEQITLMKIYKNLRDKCDAKGYELFLSNLHSTSSELSSGTSTDATTLNVNQWIDGPLEAQCGHELAALSLAEISRHSQSAYLVPILFLGGTLGAPLLPLTIESQDFCAALSTAETECVQEKALLEKWYRLDNKAQPPCYRLKSKDSNNQQSADECAKELNQLLNILIQIFSKELRDSYLTTVVEQEINNTVLMSQELSKRCIWIQNSNLPIKIADNSTKLETEMYRRLSNIHNDLKNQLNDKHIIKNHQLTVQSTHDQLMQLLEQTISLEIDSIVDEHLTKYSIPYCTYGVDRGILQEIEEVNRYTRILGQNCANFSIMDRIRNYITGSSTSPLIIFGKPGCGKSVLSAKIAHNMHTWMPECGFILRYIGLTQMSMDLVSVLGQICDQVSVLTTGQPTNGPHTIEFYSQQLKKMLETTKYQIVILLDSLDNLTDLDNLSWLPVTLQDNVKIILTITSNIQDIKECEYLVKANRGDWIINELRKMQSITINFIQFSKFSQEQWNDVMNFGGGDIYAANGAIQLSESWKSIDEKIPIQAKILWWLAWLGITNLTDLSLNNLCDKIFDILESKFNKDFVKFVVSLVIASRDGVTESEIVALLEKTEFGGELSSELWIKLCWIMGPVLMHNKNITIMDNVIKNAATKRYKAEIYRRTEELRKFYEDQRDILVDSKGKDKHYNTRKFIELPYHVYKLDSGKFASSKYFTDLRWIYMKLNAAGCINLLHDIQLAMLQLPHIKLLANFLQTNFKSLNYDSQQFYSLFIEFLFYNQQNCADATNDNEIISKWKSESNATGETYLERLNVHLTENIRQNSYDDESSGGAGDAPHTESSLNDSDKFKNVKLKYDLITNLPGKGYFVISLSTDREEICVWNAAKDIKVRTLRGVPQPSAICPVGDYGVAVLCKREIKVLDLDEGKFKVTLKGVMNQKMPYFGLHDATHLVCLSRNRMYVNLMNLESGDCVTTFKAGEDRFLNSLLVSGDGRILVCGDETQKPFPLLVWHLSQRKLLYDLRIPHHDFITSLSAITHEGSYVCVVAKELNEPTPNFIVVYDLQSGTLFKKWKPSCNTVSLAISQTNACVIAGLEDARILVWDLVTGNCKCTLIGHNAPVTLLKLDPQGKILLSGDKDGRDMSIRLWELDSGKQLAVYTPPAKITTCEILPNGKFVVLALENTTNLITLKLKNYNAINTDDNDETPNDDDIVYGKKENEGKLFEV